MPRLNPILDQLAVYPQQELERRKASVLASGLPLYDFGVGDPMEPTPLFIRQALKDALPPRCSYPSVGGSPGIRDAICSYAARRFGVGLEPGQHVLPLSGAKEGVFHMPLLVIDPAAEDRLVVFPDPGYPAYARGALFAGATPFPVRLHGDHVFRPWELPETVLKRTRLLWLNTPHNPCGVVMSLDDLQRTADICRKYDILCVSDESYADIYSGEPPHSLLECGLENVLAIHSLSKRSGMTGYRSGFVAGDSAMISRLRTLRANPGLVPQSFVNAAAEAAWSDDGHVGERRDLFLSKKRIFLDFFDEMGWEVFGRDATLYLWLRVPQGRKAGEWALELLSQGIVVSPGPMFSTTGAGSDYVRLAMVPGMEVCRKAVALWRSRETMGEGRGA
jgi:succinyldiaminopimelate transaminase